MNESNEGINCFIQMQHRKNEQDKSDFILHVLVKFLKGFQRDDKERL